MTPAPDVLHGRVTVRRARASDIARISALVTAWAAEDMLLPRTPDQVALAIDEYVVAVDMRGDVLACGALREYSPSLAELVSLAVAREAHGRGLGRLVVAQIELLAEQRGYDSVFAHSLAPAFFEAVGYDVVDRDLYPEKRARPHTTCFRRTFASDHRALAIAA